MSSVLHNAPDVTTFAANVVVFLAAIAAAVAGSMSAVKKIKESWLESASKPEEVKTTIIGGMLQDAIGSAMMSEQLRNNKQSMDDLCDELREVRIILNRIADRMDRHG